MNYTREAAKFLSGMAAWETIGHSVLAFSGDLPLTVVGITVTPTINALAVLFAFSLSALLGWYAWGEPILLSRTPSSRVGQPGSRASG